MSRDPPLERVRRVIFLRSHGRCEYLTCTRIVARISEDYRFEQIGAFAHIIPTGDGPRAEFRESTAIDLRSSQNFLLLCGEHHDLIDRLQVEAHPPEILFGMVIRRSDALESLIDKGLTGAAASADLDAVLDVRIGRVISLMNDFREAGPIKGQPPLLAARKLLVEIRRNPHATASSDAIALLEIQLAALAAADAASEMVWKRELRVAEDAAKKLAAPNSVAVAAVAMLVFVRNRLGALDGGERLALIKALLSQVEAATKHAAMDSSTLARLLGVKAALTRWRARLESGNRRMDSNAEAERCSRRSLATAWTPYGRLQEGLAQFYCARSLPAAKLIEHDERMLNADRILIDPRLSDFEPLIKYRPQYYRESFRRAEAVHSFWLAVDMGFYRDMQSNAFVGCESVGSLDCAVPEHRAEVDRMNAFVARAIRDGFDHGRNVMAWMATRALLDPVWFRASVVANIAGADGRSNLAEVLRDASRRFLDVEFGRQDILFGVDDVEFWNTFAGLCLRAGEPVKAAEYYRVAARYSAKIEGDFRTRMGLARVTLMERDCAAARRYCDLARSIALAFQVRFVDELEEQILAQSE